MQIDLNKILEWLQGRFPILKSPRFWGIVVTSTIFYLRAKGWIDELTANWIGGIIGAATLVNIGDKMATKSAGSSTGGVKVENVEHVDSVTVEPTKEKPL